MNHYDDLQRFKDKTRNQALEFKDFSSQHQENDQGSWAILNQLLPAGETQTLAAGGHVLLSVPQPVSAETFVSTEPVAEPEKAATIAEPSAAPSILNDVAEQLAAAPVINPAQVRQIQPEPAPVAVNFSRLFAPAASASLPAAEKNQPLNSLLERIATCR